MESLKNAIVQVVVIVAVLLTLAMLYLLHQNGRLKAEWETAMNNYKAYELMYSTKLDSANARNYELKLTNAQLEYSNDSVIQMLNEVRKEMKVKDKKLKELQYIETETFKRDSVILHDTIFRDDVRLDTTLADEWRTVRLTLGFPSTIGVDTRFTNKIAVVVSTEKQTIKPPSKIFFIRWFQKKQRMVKIDVVDANPYASVKEQRFVEIVK